MIVRSKPLYQKVAEKHNIAFDLVQSVGNAMFSELRTKLESPDNIVYEMPKLGIFIIRFEKYYKMATGALKKLDKQDPETLERYERDPDNFERLRKVAALIEQFRKERIETRTERNRFTYGENYAQPYLQVPPRLDKVDNLPDNEEQVPKEG